MTLLILGIVCLVVYVFRKQIKAYRNLLDAEARLDLAKRINKLDAKFSEFQGKVVSLKELKTKFPEFFQE